MTDRFAQAAADLIEFLADGGSRKSEAQNILWSDCSFERGEILVRGDEETGTKNWPVRIVRIIKSIRRRLFVALKTMACSPENFRRMFFSTLAMNRL